MPHAGEYRKGHPDQTAGLASLATSIYLRHPLFLGRTTMHTDIAEQLVDQFERGLLSRRQLASRLLGLGAALAATSGAAKAAQDRKSTFQATGLDHVALDVKEVARSRDFYIKHLGLEVIRDGGEDNCFLGSGGDFFLTLFRGDK